MISDDLRLLRRQSRVLDALEAARGHTLDHSGIEAAMYAPPTAYGKPPRDTRRVIIVTIYELRKKLHESSVAATIETVRHSLRHPEGRFHRAVGYRLILAVRGGGGMGARPNDALRPSTDLNT